MKYYIQLEKSNQRYRLQNDNSWRMVVEKEIQNSDFLTSNEKDIIKLQEIDSEIVLNSIQHKANPTSLRLLSDNNFNYHVYTFRISKPMTPLRDQLVSAIANGDDSKTNALILNTSGFYEIREIDEVNLNIKIPSIVVRNEAFIEGNGYVGKEASEDKRFIEDIYNDTLECWLNHLEKGMTNMYSDGSYMQRKTEDILNEINLFQI